MTDTDFLGHMRALVEADGPPPLTTLQLQKLLATIDALTEANTTLTRERDALADFKSYVHGRLDEAGIPVSPGGPHSDAGCRIGDRLDIALGLAEQLEQARLREREFLEAWERDDEHALVVASQNIRDAARSALPAPKGEAK